MKPRNVGWLVLCGLLGLLFGHLSAEKVFAVPIPGYCPLLANTACPVCPIVNNTGCRIGIKKYWTCVPDIGSPDCEDKYTIACPGVENDEDDCTGADNPMQGCHVNRQACLQQNAQ